MNKKSLSARTIIKRASSFTLLATALTSQQVSAHGYMTDPPDRAFSCVAGFNTNCGSARYEPQSVGEGLKGFPGPGVLDGMVPTACKSSFPEMHIQTATRWHLHEIKDRAINFGWYYTALHKTTRWEYFITKTG